MHKSAVHATAYDIEVLERTAVGEENIMRYHHCNTISAKISSAGEQRRKCESQPKREHG